MSLVQAADDEEDVYREPIKERRETYYVTYQPADSRFCFAFLNLVYPENVPDKTQIADNVSQEVVEWLSRYPVPIVAAAFDATDECVNDSPASLQFIGFVDPNTSRIVSRWSTLSDKDLPAEHLRPSYLATVYKSIPWKSKLLVRQQVDQKARGLKLGLQIFRIISIFGVGIPLLIEIISLGVAWIGYVLATISISAGAFKLGKVLGWIKPSKRQLVKDKEMQKMRHYFYHCELNPIAFNQLKIENFERQSIEETQKEFSSLPPSRKAS
jgi:hypothetical protein